MCRQDVFVKKCKCGRNIKDKKANETGLCRDCYIKKWKKDHRILKEEKRRKEGELVVSSVFTD